MESTNYAIFRGTKYANAPAMLATSEGVSQEVSAPMRDKSIPNSTTEQIPYGYCQCGCGEKTAVSKYSDQRNGYVKGEHRKFLRGHGSRARNHSPFWSHDDSCFLVPLTNGKFSRIDESEAERVGKHLWSARQYPNGFWYAEGSQGSLHRFITDCPSGMVVDHANGDTLDNRRSNLRIATRSENGYNWISTRKDNSSGYRGVNWRSREEKWQGTISAAKKFYYLGLFACPIEAAVARDIAALELHGDFASLNFPQLREVFK